MVPTLFFSSSVTFTWAFPDSPEGLNSSAVYVSWFSLGSVTFGTSKGGWEEGEKVGHEEDKYGGKRLASFLNNPAFTNSNSLSPVAAPSYSIGSIWALLSWERKIGHFFWCLVRLAGLLNPLPQEQWWLPSLYASLSSS